MGEFWKRLVFGFLFVVVVIGSIIIGKLAASLMLLIVVMMASSEIVNLFPHEQDKPLKNIVGCCSVMLYVFFVVLSGNFDFECDAPLFDGTTKRLSVTKGNFDVYVENNEYE